MHNISYATRLRLYVICARLECMGRAKWSIFVGGMRMKRGGRDGEVKVGQGHYEDQQHETNGDSDGSFESRFYLLAATS